VNPKIEFIVPNIYKLDTVQCDIAVLCLYSDDWPLRGVPSFIDWRLNGKISKLKEKGWITSRKGEKILCTLNKKFPFEKLLIIGMGVSNKFFSEKDLEFAYRETLTTLLKLKIHSFLFDIIAKQNDNLLTPTDRINILFDCLKEIPEYFEIILVEEIEAQKEIKDYLSSKNNI